MRPRIDAVAGATGQRLHYCGQRPRKRGSAGSLRARPLTAGKKAHAVAFSGDGKRPRVTDLIKLSISLALSLSLCAFDHKRAHAISQTGNDML